MSHNKYNGLTANDVVGYEHKEQIYKVCDTYIGSDEHIVREDFGLIYNENKELKIRPSTFNFAEGIERLFIEILSNATDNMIRTRKEGMFTPPITITMDEYRVKIRNGGLAIHIEKKIYKQKEYWLPHFIYGMLLTSSNYEGDREGAGRNGYGAKLVNIFSKEFIVRIGDPFNNREYTQIWKDNMFLNKDPDYSEEPTIIEGYTGDAYVEVEYLLDFNRFKLEKYTEECMSSFMYHAFQASFTSKVPVIFNSILYDYRKIDDYINLFLENKHTKYVYHEDETIKLIIIDAANGGKLFSFVNGMITRNGGVHVNKLRDAIEHNIIYNTKNEKIKNGKLVGKHFTKYLLVISSFNIKNPKFKSQTKDYLTSPTPIIKLPDDLLKNIDDWDMIKSLEIEIHIQKLKETKQKRKDPPKLSKAVNHGIWPNSEKVTLVLSEGDSTDQTVKMYADQLGGPEWWSVLPLKGKIANVSKIDQEKLEKSEIIRNIENALNLVKGVDYTDILMRKTLSCGRIAIMTDSDVDGEHIKGLIQNFIATYYPSLFYIMAVVVMKTPLIKVKLSNTILRFYYQYDFDEWRKSNADKRLEVGKNIHYLKGLGSSDKEDIKEDAQHLVVKTLIYDDNAKESLELAFSSSKTKERRQWISDFKTEEPLRGDKLTISDFINKEFVEYSRYTLRRAIPSICDGLKNSQRKTLFSALKRWNTQSGFVKVESMAGYAVDVSGYHHGQKSIAMAMVKMTQDYVGSNNLPLFQGKGQFGTRDNGGKASAERYIFMNKKDYLFDIFPQKYTDVYTYTEQEGDYFEPDCYYPLLPMHLINGCSGVATGNSTFIPPHNPKDIYNAIVRKLQGKNYDHFKPYYKGFNGIIEELISKSKIKKIKQQTSDDFDQDNFDQDNFDEEIQNNNVDVEPGHLYYKTYGLFNYNNKKDSLEINELPIGLSVDKYKEILTEEIFKNSKVENHTKTGEKIHFIIKKCSKSKTILSYETLQLVTTISTSNMVLLDEYGKPHKYATVEDILEDYIRLRLEFLVTYKSYQLSLMKKELDRLQQIYGIINNIIHGKININAKSKQEIESQLNIYNYSYDIFNKIKLSQITQDGVTKITDKLNKAKEEMEKYQTIDSEDIWLEELKTIEKYL